MKRLLIGLLILPCVAVAKPLPDNIYFRAMNDEMQRAIKELRLKDHPDPYYIAYWLRRNYNWEVEADMGTLTPLVYDPADQGRWTAETFVSVGSDKQDGLGFSDTEPFSWQLRQAELPQGYPAPGYDSIRQYLWWLTDTAYVQAANLYKKKKSYKQKKNIHDTLPDVMPAKPAYFVEDIVPFVHPDVTVLQRSVKEWSSLGKTLPYMEKFRWKIDVRHTDWYYLNSRGAVAQYSYPAVWVYGTAEFRQPDGKVSTTHVTWWLKDTSEEELTRTHERVEEFLAQIKQAYGAKSGEAYVGPVLLKPGAAAQFVWNAVLSQMRNSKPWLLTYSDDDKEAGKLYKKQHLRVSTDLLTMYDRPLLREFEGITLSRFRPVDAEGVAAENLTLVQNGHVKDFPLTQRPLTKNHRSNGHAQISQLYGPREDLTNVFIEPTETWTDEQMEEKLLARCRELGLEYGYILHEPNPSGDLGIERIYTKDGRKETVLNLKWDGNFFTQRDLRSVLAVGGKAKLAENFYNKVIVTPSVLMSEVELVPQEHKPHRQPFIAKPK